MQKFSSFWYVLAGLLVGGALVALNAGWVQSGSIDIAHHYSLVFRLSENWSLVPNDPTLEEMNVYPRYSHLAAALVGKLVGSPFLGMQLVAVIALVILWAACLAILYAAPGRTGPFNAIVMALAVVLNVGAFRIHGAEISQNYFFAQLVAQALAMAAIATAIRVDARFARGAGYAVLLGAILLITGVHLLPAIELLAVLAGLLVLDVAFVPVPQRQRVQRALVACVVLAIGTMLVVLHPAFTAMRGIANNNGDISLGPLAPLWSVVLMSLIALPCSLSLLRIWRRDPVASGMYKYLGVYGAAVASLCLLQAVLRAFHIGSDYAVKKYAFAVVTFLFMRLALWLGNKLAVQAVARARFANVSKHPAFAIQVFAIALFATVAGAAKTRHDIDIGAVVRFEHALMQLPVTAFPPPPDGRQNVILDLHGMPKVIDYMFSLAIAHTSRDVALLVHREDRRAQAQLPLTSFGTIVTSPNGARFAAAPRCAIAQGHGLVAINTVCLGRLPVAALAKDSLAAP
jgi:hypothetical protein